MKKYRRFANFIAFAAVIAAVAAVPMSASAAGTTYSSTLTTENDKKVTTLDKYLVMKADANVPNAQFTFSVAPGTAIDADKENIFNDFNSVNDYGISENAVYPTSPEGSAISYPYQVPENCVFVLNDFRSDLSDSRTYGGIPLEDVEGAVVFTMRMRGI